MTHSRNRQQIALSAVLAAALLAAGAAYAARKVHNSSASPGSSGPLSAGFVSSNSGGHGFAGDHHRRGGDALTAAATYLGVTEAALKTQLDAGKTLAQVADATSGKSAAGLIDALVAHEKTELAAAVTAGRISQARADVITATLKARFTALANGTRPARGDGHGLRPGFVPRGTAPSGSAQSSGTHV
jgi:hypothetical protein